MSWTARYAARRARVKEALGAGGIDALVVTVGPEMPWLIGYEAMPLERITALVLRADGEAALLIPELEAPRLRHSEGLEVIAWADGIDPFDRLAALLPGQGRALIGERSRAGWLLELERRRPGVRFEGAAALLAPLRRHKDPEEVAALAAAGAAADRVAAALLAGEIPLLGRTEREVSREIAERLVAEGHARANFSIVASGPNGASPHHEAGSRRIEAGDLVVCDFGGVFEVDGEPGYCSDTTRTVAVASASEEARRVHAAVRAAHDAAIEALRPGIAAGEVDRIARERLAAEGLAEWFMHRLGHGIGLEEHEEPYLAPGAGDPLLVGDAFSIEPGVYLPGRLGVRIEDIVVLDEGGPRLLNLTPTELVVLEGGGR